MINYIWGLMILLGSFFSIINGNTAELNDTLNNSIKSGISTIINMMGTICFWNGVINVLINTSLKDKILLVLRPLLGKLFPNLKNDNKIIDKIGMNMTFNILGLGNAATPIGIEVVDYLERKNNKKVISDEIILFILINTVSIQLIPTTIIALRNSYNSMNSNIIVFPILMNSIITFGVIIFLAKIYIKYRRKCE